MDGINSWEIANTKIKYYLPAAGALCISHWGQKCSKTTKTTAVSGPEEAICAMCGAWIRFSIWLQMYIQTHIHTCVYVCVCVSGHTDTQTDKHVQNCGSTRRWALCGLAVLSNFLFDTLSLSLCVRVIVSFAKLRMHSTVGTIKNKTSKINKVKHLYFIFVIYFYFFFIYFILFNVD